MTPITPPLFSILSALVQERSGIHYGPDDAGLFGDKVSTRAVERGFESLLDYYYFLRYDDPDGRELEALIDSIVVGETYFFRELDPLVFLADEVLAPRIERGARVRVWSAACSTGEEPLTLAMVLAARGLLASTEIVATDISNRSLDRARRGVYSSRSMRAPPPPIADPWLREIDGNFEVSAHLREHIAWSRVNLTDDLDVAKLGLFDAIICRNVLIYFVDETVRGVVSRLSNALAPTGVLLVGVSESLLRFSTVLDCVERKGTFHYRKRPR